MKQEKLLQEVLSELGKIQDVSSDKKNRKDIKPRKKRIKLFSIINKL